jgi:hypothetical protein
LALQRIQTELNLSVTPFEVLEEPGHGDEQHPDDNFEETRVRSIASIDPDASGTATTGSAPTFPARTFPSTVPGNNPPQTAPQPAARPTLSQDSAQQAAAAAQQTAPQRFHTAPPVLDEPDSAESTVLRGWQPSGTQDNVDQTVSRSASQPSGDTGEEVPAGDHSRRNLWLAVTGAGVLVVAIVVGVVLGAQAQPKVAPSESVSKPPADPLDNGSVPDVQELTATRDTTDPNIVVFSWKNPQPKEGDSYKWRTKSAKADGPYETTRTQKAFVSGLDEPPICLQVIIVRADGNASPEGPDSIACLDK